MKKLKKYSEFSEKEIDNIKFNRETIGNKEIFFLVVSIYKKILPIMLVFIVTILIFNLLFYYFY